LVPLCQPVVRAHLSRAGAKGVRPLCRAEQEGDVNEVIVLAANVLIGAVGGFAVAYIFGWRAGREKRANMVWPYIRRTGEPIVPPPTISWRSTPVSETPATPASQVRGEQ